MKTSSNLSAGRNNKRLLEFFQPGSVDLFAFRLFWNHKPLHQLRLREVGHAQVHDSGRERRFLQIDDGKLLIDIGVVVKVWDGKEGLAVLLLHLRHHLRKSNKRSISATVYTRIIYITCTSASFLEFVMNSLAKSSGSPCRMITCAKSRKGQRQTLALTCARSHLDKLQNRAVAAIAVDCQRFCAKMKMK